MQEESPSKSPPLITIVPVEEPSAAFVVRLPPSAMKRRRASSIPAGDLPAPE